MSVVVIYDLPQTIPFSWYITCGLWVYSYCLRKIQYSHRGLKG